MKNKILITGANGFVGKYVCDALEKIGVEYLGLVQSAATTSLPAHRIVEGNLQNKERLENILNDYQPDAILHLAAIASPTYGQLSKIYEVNVEGSENLLEATRNNCKEGTRMILASTAGVYGNQDISLLNENCPYNPVNHYSYSKVVMELMSRQYKDDLDICIVRPFNMIGVGQQDNFLVPKLVKHYVSKAPKLKLGNMNTARDYVAVDYAVNIFTELLLRESIDISVLNICTGISTTGMELLNMLADITGYQPEIEIDSEFVRRNEVWHMIGDPTQLNSFITNKMLNKSVRKILEEMVQMYR